MVLQAVCRDEVEALRPLLADPERFIAAGVVLKAGNSATVAGVEVSARQLVVKRYNIKGFAHWLRRFWRPSRAWHSWREGHRLAFLGVATARPLAVLERRTCWLRGRAYLMTEKLDGDNILVRFAPYLASAPPAAEMSALGDLFAALVREHISHGDMKGSNLLWHGGRWVLVDLDAMQQHTGRRSFVRAFAKDRARFLRNWPADSALYRFLDERLPQVSDLSLNSRG
jgi:tRNA A-37 threonylcarbamoyl transferase component Bud32